jgi:thioredoxin-like negative regulator of GroEL
MRVVALYHPASDSSRRVEEFAHDYSRQTGGEVELVSLDGKDGADIAKTYDIVGYPAILVIRNDGQLMQNWQGSELPLIREVAAQAAL